MQTNFLPTPYGSSFTTIAPTAQRMVDPSPVTILIVEPQNQLHQTYIQMLTDCLSAAVDVTFVNNGSEAVLFYKNRLPDLVILDVKTTEVDVFETARCIWTLDAEAQIVFLAETHREWHLRQIKKILPAAKLYGYILKSQSAERIGYGIECVFKYKNTYIDSLAHAHTSNSKNSLTDAEYETLIDMALGLTDRAIAQRRNVSVRGVQNRINLIFQKLLDHDPLKCRDLDGGMVNLRVRAVMEAIRRGLLEVEHLLRYEAELLGSEGQRQTAI